MTYEDILYDHRVLLWSARILGTIEAVLLFYLAFTGFREENWLPVFLDLKKVEQDQTTDH